MIKQPPAIRISEGTVVSGRAISKAQQLYSFVEQQLHIAVAPKRLDRRYSYPDYIINITLLY